jgi:hypothetical protein
MWDPQHLTTLRPPRPDNGIASLLLCTPFVLDHNLSYHVGSTVRVERRLGGSYGPFVEGRKVSIIKKQNLIFYQTSRCYIPENKPPASHLGSRIIGFGQLEGQCNANCKNVAWAVRAATARIAGQVQNSLK